MQICFLPGSDETLDQIRDVLQQAVEKFSEDLAATVPRPETVVLVDRKVPREDWRRYRRLHPFHRRPGVYLLYSAAGELLYVGKGASHKQRLDRCFANDRPERRWVLAVTFEEEWSHMAVALEQFLIRRLKPRHNRIAC